MIVYLARNTKNGKAYVGKTERDLDQRRKEHERFARLNSPQPLHRAIRKHGADAFEWSVLCMLSSDCDGDDLNLMEAHYIEKMGTFGSGGYNATRGGDGVRGLVHSAETRAKMSEARRGEKNHNYGKSWGLKGPRSEATKQKMSQAAQGRKHSDETRRKISLGSARPKVAIPVHQLDTEGNVVATHQSVHQACRSLDVWPYGIKACCEGRRQNYAGYGWKYARG